MKNNEKFKKIIALLTVIIVSLLFIAMVIIGIFFPSKFIGLFVGLIIGITFASVLIYVILMFIKMSKN